MEALEKARAIPPPDKEAGPSGVPQPASKRTRVAVQTQLLRSISDRLAALEQGLVPAGPSAPGAPAAPAPLPGVPDPDVPAPVPDVPEPAAPIDPTPAVPAGPSPEDPSVPVILDYFFTVLLETEMLKTLCKDHSEKPTLYFSTGNPDWHWQQAKDSHPHQAAKVCKVAAQKGICRAEGAGFSNQKAVKEAVIFCRIASYTVTYRG
ncbi:uncharacterized protein LOC128340206 [Hemicordylus capensis]|uniref:uncharacterized protein LOC128340206 n=1 Tax=Hemicordylus capensis TaxID=884348 RepID=UPI00230271E6|nr:uncharacterized protein LOC128340206 [Hemicordylus capensis]